MTNRNPMILSVWEGFNDRSGVSESVGSALRDAWYEGDEFRSTPIFNSV